MNNPYMPHLEKEGVLHPGISDAPEMGNIEVSLNVTADLNGQGSLTGIEISTRARSFGNPYWELVRASCWNSPEPNPHSTLPGQTSGRYAPSWSVHSDRIPRIAHRGFLVSPPRRPRELTRYR